MNKSGCIVASMAALSLSLFVAVPAVAAPNYALSLDGSSSYVDTGTAVIPTSGDFTVELWVNLPAGTSAHKELLSQGTSGNALYIGADYNNYLRLGDIWSPSVAFPVGGWHHLALVKSSTNVIFYLDGTNRVSKGSTMANPVATAFRLGRQYGGYAEYWPGALDDVRIWSRALSSTEILTNRLQRPTGAETGLVAAWEFDEGTGTNCATIGSLALTNGVIGSMRRVPSGIPWPAADNALFFNGSSACLDAGRGIIPTNGDYTVACWAFCPTNAVGGLREIISQGSLGNAFYLGKTDGNGNIRLGDGWMDTGVVFPLDSWHHIAVVKSSTNTILYMDGTNRASIATAIPNPATNSFCLGRQYGSYGEYWPGAVDDVRVWSRALNATEIQFKYNRKPTGGESGLIAAWEFDEGTGANCAAIGGSSAVTLQATNGTTWMASPVPWLPSITSPPAPQLAVPGGTATFTVGAINVTGYQWYGPGSTLMAVATNSTLVLTNVTLASAGNYFVVLTNACGATTSSNALLTVVDFGGMSNRVSSLASAITLTASISNATAFTYQWVHNGTNLPTGIISTVAGGGNMGPYFWGENGPATANFTLNSPTGVAVDQAGNLFIADYDMACIRKVNAAGIITTVAGNGSSGCDGDDGPARYAAVSALRVVADAAGNLYFSDPDNSHVRKVSAAGIITTVAGTGYASYSGEGLAVTNALNQPAALNLDRTGNLYIGDSGNSRIRKVATNGIMSTVSANYALGVFMDPAGNLFFSTLPKVFKVDTNGVIATVAGTNLASYCFGDGGLATNAELNLPADMVTDWAGNLFIMDTGNDRIRRVGANGIITTYAGCSVSGNSSGYSGDGGTATSAQLSLGGQPLPWLPGLAMDDGGNLFIADVGNHVVRRVTCTTSPTLRLYNVASTDLGDYQVVLTSVASGLSVTSPVVTLTLPVPPTVTAQPTNVTAPVGTTAQISAVVTGTAPISYQWYWQGPGAIAGATNATLTLNAVTTNQAGVYYLVAGNVAGTATSSNAILTVLFPPTITQPPMNVAAWIGAPAQLSVAAVGTAPLYYQWYDPNLRPLPEATNATLSWSSLAATNAGAYAVVVSNAYGLAFSCRGLVSPLKWEWNGNNPQSNTLHTSFSDPGGVVTIPVRAIAAGGYFSLALKADGTVIAWGWSEYGQTTVPATATNVVAIAAGFYHSLALKADGTVVAWGYNDSGQTDVPATATNVVAIAGGRHHSLTLKADGAVVAWGFNGYGVTNVPATATNVVAIAGGGYHSLVLQADGTVVAWGNNGSGQTTVPATATNVVAIAAGFYHSLALKADGTVVAWGNNGSGQTDVPTTVTNVVAIAAGDEHSLALKADGTVVAWGNNGSGQTDVPTTVTNVVAIAAGGEHSLALKADGTVVAWGYNYNGLTPIPSFSQTVTTGSGTVNTNVVGNYTLTYSCTNVWGTVLTTNLTVVVWQAVLNPPSLGNLAVIGGTVGFTVGGDSGQTVVVETCTNLAAPVWVPVQTNTLDSGPVNFSAPVEPQSPSRFYRLRTP